MKDCLRLLVVLICTSSFILVFPGKAELPAVFGVPIPGLTMKQLADFDDGFQLFARVWTVQEGLGPYINQRSCAACHNAPVPGGSGTSAKTLVPNSATVRDPAGGHVFRRLEVRKNGFLVGRPLPLNSTMRRTPPLFGVGLLESVPTETLLNLADPADRDGDGISGRLPKMGNRYGRFGWKGVVPSVADFVATALAVEMGLSSSKLRDNALKSLPPEITSEVINAISTYVRLLDAPPRGQSGLKVSEGEIVFRAAGCSKCHHPSLPVQISELAPGSSRERIWAYTDLLVHDMGSSLGDGIEINGVSGLEFRTPPLWGLRSVGPPYLHDGRARSIEEAIILHGGEGLSSADRFKALTEKERQKLLFFLENL